ncbi:hypothetical protein K523DRAFT_366707 [Schizophyllum commune Tattone D]|nr:hypothetical protein K523DRAFT_366707 [Schizophyllum commune Tattone D]
MSATGKKTLSDEVRKLIAHMRKRPEWYRDATLPLLQSTNKQALSYEALDAARAHPETLSTTTDGSPYAVSEYERVMYYHATGGPVLLYRSDLHERPYPLLPAPPPPRCPSRSGAHGPALRAAEMEMLDLKLLTRIRDKWGITVFNASIMFYEEGPGDGAGEAGEGAADGEPPVAKFRPFVMVHVHPGGVTDPQAAHDASEEILDLFEKHGVPRGRLTVEWGEQNSGLLSGVSAEVREIIADMRERPDWYLHQQASALLRGPHRRARAPRGALNDRRQLAYSISEYERIMYYHAQGAKAPALLYRSDLHERPYPLPPASPPPRCPSPFSTRRTAMHGLWNDNEDPRAMRRKLGERGIRWVTILIHFYNEGGDGEEECEEAGEDPKGEDEQSKEQEESKKQEQKGVTSRPVIMIHVEPGGATAEQAHTASEEILMLLEAQGVPRGDVTVEWKEGHVRRWGLGENYVELEERPSANRGDAYRNWETRTGIVGSSKIR